MDKLQSARIKINDIDKKIASLFEERMEAVKLVAEYKKECGLPVFDNNREQMVIENNLEYIKNESIKSYYVNFIKSTMEISKKYQHQLLEGLKIAYSGVEGAFANIAAKKIFPDGYPISYADFASAYNAVVDGECDCAVLPIENSYAGEVGKVTDLMFKGSLYINGVYALKISHNLIGLENANLNDITTVISHPQALNQCNKYLIEHKLLKIEAENTALAAKMVKDKNDLSYAAIASAETANLYGLKIIDHDINTSDQNTTKFAVFSRIKNENANKDSFILLFTVKHEVGALAKAINIIGNYGFNMKALRSRPIKDQAFEYYFYVEAEGDETSQNAKNMLKDLSKQCDRLKIVGHYTLETI